jgi:hypothetical protein
MPLLHLLLVVAVVEQRVATCLLICAERAEAAVVAVAMVAEMTAVVAAVVARIDHLLNVAVEVVAAGKDRNKFFLLAYYY